jgi:hypothetical protein
MLIKLCGNKVADEDESSNSRVATVLEKLESEIRYRHDGGLGWLTPRICQKRPLTIAHGPPPV